MKYGVCPLSVVPLRHEKADRSELINQVLYGETFKVLDVQKKWSKIRLSHDNYEGWIDNKQYLEISEEDYKSLSKSDAVLSHDLVQYINTPESGLMSVPLGVNVGSCDLLDHSFEGNTVSGIQSKDTLIETALLFMNSPYLWGGRTPFGIDCSGFTQMVYRLCGHRLFRDASQQATQGDPLSFIEESEPGDLAFFDNEEGNIIHVGLIMEDNYIIHAHGQVRIDRLDHTGIFNSERRMHTHKLRVIKRIV